MIPNRRTLVALTAAASLTFSAAAASAQAGAVPTAKPSDQPATQAAAQSPEAPRVPLWLKQGAEPSAEDPIPAPTSPVPPADEVAMNQTPLAPGETVTAPGSSTPRTWTTDQILTATVHQAWILAGKDESNFFEIVTELAAISASNRNVTLPDTPEAGKKAGAYIRAQSKEDHDQLLYEIVDKAVRMTGTKPSASAAAAHPVQ